MRGSILGAASLGLLLLAPWARAEEAPEVPGGNEAVRPSAVIVTLRGTQAGLHYRLFAEDEERPLATCGEGCRVRLPQGRYKIQVFGPPGSDVRTSEQSVDLFEDTVLRVEPPSSSSRSTGLALGITGASLLAVGATVFWVGLVVQWSRDLDDDQACAGTLSSSCSPPHHGPNYALWTGAGMLVAAAIMTPVGWVMFARNSRPRLEVMSPGQPTNEAGRWRVGPTRVGTGWGFGSSVSF